MLLAVLTHRGGVREHVGLLTGTFLVGYGVARTFVELYREPDPQLGFISGPVTMGQILSAPMVLLGLYLVLRAFTESVCMGHSQDLRIGRSLRFVASAGHAYEVEFWSAPVQR